MIKHLKKHHLKLGLIILSVSFGIIFISVLWRFGIINLPGQIIYSSTRFSNFIYGNSDSDFELPLKFHRQEHSLSSETAALKMVLNYQGVDVSESEITSKLSFDNTSHSGNVWGDPSLGFVGNIDGKMMVDGYGVYWGPIALVASNWKKVKIIKNGSAKDLVENISQGRPVIVWGYVGRGQPVSWQTAEGQTVHGINGEHARVVYGYSGPANNPDGFMVMDSVYGPGYWRISKFIRNWDAFGRIGIAVFKEE